MTKRGIAEVADDASGSLLGVSYVPDLSASVNRMLDVRIIRHG